MHTTTQDKLDISMITDIIEDGKKLRSINELMAKYDLKFPFTAYNHKYQKEVLLIKTSNPGVLTELPCCNKIICNDSGSVVAISTPCTGCATGKDNQAGWGLDYKNWTLAGY